MSIENKDQEFLEALVKRANLGIEARRAIQYYYPHLVELVTVDNKRYNVCDELGIEIDLAKEFKLKEVKDV